MSDKPVPPNSNNLEAPSQPTASAVNRQETPSQQHQPSPLDQASAPSDSAGGIDPSSAMSGMDGMSPDSFLGPIQQIGSQIGQIPQQFSQALGPATSGLQQPLSMLQSLGSQAAGGLPNGTLPKIPAGHSGQEGHGGGKTKLDPEEAHATTGKAEAEAAQHVANAAKPQAMAGHAPTDAAAALIATSHTGLKNVIRGHVSTKSTADAGARRSGTSLIEGADIAGAGQQTSVQGRLI